MTGLTRPQRVPGISRDEWRVRRFGFRTDWDADEANFLTVQGGAYSGDIGLLAPSIEVLDRPGPEGNLQTGVNGGHVLRRWRHKISDDSDLQVRFYCDRTQHL